MSELLHLIPNLNKMMEEYTKGEENSVQETRLGIMHEGERSETRIETEQPIKETRKRKRGAKEAEQKEEKSSDLVSKRAYFAWRDKLQHRDFIGKRGFNKLISPFQEVIEKKGWNLFCDHKALGFVDLVKEFYANTVGIKEKTVYVRDKWISFNRENISQTFNLNERKNGSKFKKLIKEPDFQKIVDLLTNGKGKWNATRKNPHESIA